MGRPRKNATAEIIEDNIVLSEDRPVLDPTGVNIADLVKSVKGRYAKKKGLANDLVTGNNVALSDNDSDYVLSDEIKAFWKPLTGIKGAPFGRILQISGKPDSGKSTLAMLFMKAAQVAGYLVILWDSEKKFSSRRYDNYIGGDSSSIPVTRNKSIIEGAKQFAAYIKEAKEQNPNVKILGVWDSVGATLNSSEDDDENDDYSKQPGVSAKEVSWAIKKFNKLIERFRNVDTGEETISILCINQSYSTIGMGVSVQKEKGGQELEYLSSLILQLTRKKDLTKVKGGNKIKHGIVTRAKVKKNHLFDGEDCIAELELAVSADGIKLKDEAVSSSWILEEED